MNELLLIGSILVIFGAELAFYKLFAKSGLYVFTAIATIAAKKLKNDGFFFKDKFEG